MKEKLAQQPIKVHRYNGKTYLTLNGVDQILTLLKEGIEKVGNPYPITTRFDDPRYMDRLAHECFEECRQAILKILEGK